MNIWLEFFRPVLIVFQLLGFSFGYAPAEVPALPLTVPPQPRPFEWTPEARSDFVEMFGGMLALESVCQLTYDPPALAAFVEKIVPASDNRFMGDVARMRRLVLREVAQTPKTEKTLLCLQTSRAAKQFGFLR